MYIMPGIRAVGFDMDGTLMDTKVDMARMSRAVGEEFGALGVPMEVMLEDAKSNSTKESLAWISRNNPEGLIGLDERINRHAMEIEMESVPRSAPFPGAVELVTELRDRGLKVGILTRGGRDYVMAVLNHSGITDMFDAIICRDDYPANESKPSPRSMEHLAEKLGVECPEILFVGDGAVDYQAAAASGSRFVAVETGEMSHEGWMSIDENIETVPSVADLRLS